MSLDLSKSDSESDIGLQPGQYLVEKIVDDRFNKGLGRREYKVKWEGYPSSENTWEPTDSFRAEGGKWNEHFELYILEKHNKKSTPLRNDLEKRHAELRRSLSAKSDVFESGADSPVVEPDIRTAPRSKSAAEHNTPSTSKPKKKKKKLEPTQEKSKSESKSKTDGAYQLERYYLECEAKKKKSEARKKSNKKAVKIVPENSEPQEGEVNDGPLEGNVLEGDTKEGRKMEGEGENEEDIAEPASNSPAHMEMEEIQENEDRPEDDAGASAAGGSLETPPQSPAIEHDQQMDYSDEGSGSEEGKSPSIPPATPPQDHDMGTHVLPDLLCIARNSGRDGHNMGELNSVRIILPEQFRRMLHIVNQARMTLMNHAEAMRERAAGLRTVRLTEPGAPLPYEDMGTHTTIQMHWLNKGKGVSTFDDYCNERVNSGDLGETHNIIKYALIGGLYKSAMAYYNDWRSNENLEPRVKIDALLGLTTDKTVNVTLIMQLAWDKLIAKNRIEGVEDTGEGGCSDEKGHPFCQAIQFICQQCSPSLVNARTMGKGWTALNVAVCSGTPCVVHALLQAGAVPSLLDADLTGILGMAVSRQGPHTLPIVQQLTYAAANMHHVDSVSGSDLAQTALKYGNTATNDFIEEYSLKIEGDFRKFAMQTIDTGWVLL